MKLAYVAATAVCIGMAFVACQKDKILSGNQQPSAHEKADSDQEDRMAAFFDKNRSADRQIFSIPASKGGVIVAQGGTKFIIGANELRNPDGSLISGNVTVSVLEVYGRDKKLLDNFTTEAAYNPDENNQILTSAATFDVDMTTQNGGEVITASEEGIEVNVPVNIAGGPDPDMTVWEGEPSADQPRDNAWGENGAPLEIVGDHYRFHMAAPWIPINLDRRLTDFANAIHLRVSLPSGYTDANAEVFVVFDGYANAMASMDVYDPLTGVWTEHLDLVDPGTAIHIVAVGVDLSTGGLTYHISAVTTAINNPNGDDYEVIPTMSFTTTSALTTAINLIP